MKESRVNTPRSTRTPFIACAGRPLGMAVGILSTMSLLGCETNSWFDPSRTGYFEFTPTTLPVLSRIDVVEREESEWAKAVPPSADDLQPGELQYQLAAGDEIRVEVFELVAPGQTDVALRVVDPSGNIRLPTIGEVPAAGLTVAELQEEIEERLRGFITDPIVSVVLERGQGFSFIIYGAISGTGVYGLTRPDFRLMDALALAGGTFSTTENVYVIRSAPLEGSLEPSYRDRGLQRGGDRGSKPDSGQGQPVDIESLIDRLPGGESPPSPPPPQPPLQPENDPPTDPPTDPPIEPTRDPAGPQLQVSPGALSARQDSPPTPPIDIDELTTPTPMPPPATPGATTPGTAQTGGTRWVWDAATQSWVRSTAPDAVAMQPAQVATPFVEPRMYATRIIQVDYGRLAKGDSNLNIVVRPGDRIYVDPPVTGVVYIGGEISRPGVYELPQTGGKLTLSRLVDAAGGLSQLAIPARVDLIRKVGPGREAAIRVDLGAIRMRSEPDIVMKPDDHIIIGTNFFAVPLAVIRNGFRMTYGFGFLLDRNFGNDVFGPPPVNVVGE